MCDLCGRGDVIRQTQEIAFRQETDKGYVFCRATIQIGICTHCGHKSLDDAAEAILDEAVRQEYDKLP